MKKALIQMLVIPTIFLIGTLLNAVFPPTKVESQTKVELQIVTEKSVSMNIQEAKALLNTAEQNAVAVAEMLQISKNARSDTAVVVPRSKQWTCIQYCTPSEPAALDQLLKNNKQCLRY